MKVFYNEEFTGFYPVGTSAIVIAPNKGVAATMLEKELEEIGLSQSISPDSMIEVDTSHRKVIVIQNGDY